MSPPTDLEREIAAEADCACSADGACLHHAGSNVGADLRNLLNVIAGLRAATSADVIRAHERETIARWLDGLASRRDCPEERRCWYRGVAIDLRADTPTLQAIRSSK